MNIRVIELHNREEAARWLRITGADPYGVSLMSQKTYMRVLLLEEVDNRAAALLKQELLALGGEAATGSDVSRFVKGTSTVVIAGTMQQYHRLLEKLSLQPFNLKIWGKKIAEVLSNYDITVFNIPCRKHSLTLGKRPLVMGILNITPDSFSDSGKYFKPEQALERARAMITEGADIIDIGGESSRPGAKPVSASEEAKRVIPIIKYLSRTIRVPISIDTYKADVAAEALRAGAHIVNDITAMRHNKGAMAAVVKKYRVPVILMHMQGEPQTMQKDPQYNDVIGNIEKFFLERMIFAESHGIKREQIILDPGIGFGKTFEHNLTILRRLHEFRSLGRPLLVGASRKAFIGRALGDIPPQGRLAGSLAAHIRAVEQGAHIVRVHDVKETGEALRIITAIHHIHY